MVRRQPLPGLPLHARPLGRDGRGFGRIRSQAHPRRIGFCRRGSPRPRRDARPRLPRQPLFVRLPRLPQPRRPEAIVGATPRRRNRHHPQRRRPARPRAIHLRHRPPPPPGEVLFGLKAASGAKKPAALPWWTGKYWKISIFGAFEAETSARKSLIPAKAEGKFPNRSNRELNRPNREPKPRNR